MPNYRKSFNFRHGVQVDEDNFVVNSVGLVGIGTTVPTELLDVLGNAKISGILSVNQIQVSGGIVDKSGVTDFTQLNIGITSIVSGIITASTVSGVVTYYGDGGRLLNLPTSQWLDVDAGLGFTSIYAQGYVGVGTIDPRFLFQVGGNTRFPSFVNGVGIDDRGNIQATGVVTARSFVGIGSNLTLLDASNVSSGTLNNSRLPANLNISGIITANTHFSGRLVGIAETADSITRTANIFVNSINSGFSTSGLSTITDRLHVQGSIGIGTLNPNSDLHLRRSSSAATIQLTSESNNTSRIVLGRGINITTNNVILQAGDTALDANPESSINSFDIVNYSPGNFNSFIRPNLTPNLKFNWINDSTNAVLMSLTANGNLGIGTTTPINSLSVIGVSTVTEDSFVGKNLYTRETIYSYGGSNITGNSIFNTRVGIKTNVPFYDLQIGGDPIFTSGISFSQNGNVISSGIVTASFFSGNGSGITNINGGSISSGTIGGSVSVNSTGIVTAFAFSGIGSQITLLNPGNIAPGTITGNVNMDVTGAITASSFTGDGSGVTNLSPNNISNGTISGAIDINSTGTITASSFVGDGFNLTSINPSSITSGTIQNAIDINITGIVTATAIDAVSYPENIASGFVNNDLYYGAKVGIGSTTLTSPLHLKNSNFEAVSAEFTAVVGVAEDIDEIVIATEPFDCCEYLLVVKNSTSIQTQKILVTKTASNTLFLDTIVTRSSPSAIATVSVAVDTGSFFLRLTPLAGNAGSMTYKYYRTVLS